MHLPSEFLLVAAACRWPPSPGRDAAILAAAGAPLSWERVLAFAARHRVEGLVHDGLTRSSVEVPAPAAAALAAAARRIARENLGFAAEAARLAAGLERAGVDFLFLKGVTLNRLAYGTLALKRSADIDIAVDPDRYAEAAEAVRAAGYVAIAPAGDPPTPEILAWAARTKHSVWMRGATLVELHAALVDNPRLLKCVGVHSRTQWVEIAPGVRLPTLADAELFAYLSVHGATHAWSRLKWLADLAALVAIRRPEEAEPLYRAAQALGAGRSAAQALLLAADLLALPLPAALEAELRSVRVHRSLVRAALRAMLAGGARELDDLPLGTAAIHISHFRLGEGWRYKASELRRKLAPPPGSAARAGPVAALAAAPLWLIRRSRAAAARRSR